MQVIDDEKAMKQQKEQKLRDAAEERKKAAYAELKVWILVYVCVDFSVPETA